MMNNLIVQVANRNVLQQAQDDNEPVFFVISNEERNLIVQVANRNVLQQAQDDNEPVFFVISNEERNLIVQVASRNVLQQAQDDNESVCACQAQDQMSKSARRPTQMLRQAQHDNAQNSVTVDI